MIVRSSHKQQPVLHTHAGRLLSGFVVSAGLVSSLFVSYMVLTEEVGKSAIRPVVSDPGRHIQDLIVEVSSDQPAYPSVDYARVVYVPRWDLHQSEYGQLVGVESGWPEMELSFQTPGTMAFHFRPDRSSGYVSQDLPI